MKIYFFTLLLFLNLFGSAQILSESFSATPNGYIPGGWLQYNGDSNTVSPLLNAFNFSTKAWITYNAAFSQPQHGNVIASTSWYNPAGTSNDWLISPTITVLPNSVLNWEGLALDAFNPDGYEVRISTTGTAISTFTTLLFSTTAENPSWTTHTLSLNTFSNQAIRIAFINKSTDSYVLFLDNIEVLVPLAYDGAVISIDNQHRYSDFANFWPYPFCGTFKNVGATPISQIELKFQVNQNTIVSQTFSYSPPIAYNQLSSFCFTADPYTFFNSYQTNIIKVWASSVNSFPETNHLNDTALFEVLIPVSSSGGVGKKNLIEVFSSSSSETCAQLNLHLDSLLNTYNPNTGNSMNVIKYQLNMPSPGDDPSYNVFSKTRKDFYKMTTLPVAILNGNTTLVDYTDTEINSHLGTPTSFFSVNFAHPKIQDRLLTTTLNISWYYNLQTNSTVKFYFALLQKHYFYADATSSQKQYYHVERAMWPNASGIHITAPQHMLIPLSYSFSLSNLPQQNSSSFWNEDMIDYELVGFFQDTTTHEILQSGSIKLKDLTTGIKEKSYISSDLSLYPNPTKDIFLLKVDNFDGAPYLITILDCVGQEILRKTESGSSSKFDISSFEEGLYFVKINQKEKITTLKLVVTK